MNIGFLRGLAVFLAVSPVLAYAEEPIGTVRELYDGTLTPDLVASTLRNIDRLFPTRTAQPSTAPHRFEPAAKQLKQAIDPETFFDAVVSALK